MLEIADEQAAGTSMFSSRLRSQSIKTRCIRGLGPYRTRQDSLMRCLALSIPFFNLKNLGKWIDGLGGIQRFGDYRHLPDFKNDVEDFMVKVEKLGKVIGKVVDWILGKTDAAGIIDGVKSESTILNANP
ncbi:hypothetical protein [Citrobacter portucalensis]|uniref:hypothetical protein n=1 Tax=Citrobacter portucalensis TaxID=1639133 RepID=UPI003F1A9248